MPNEDWHKVVIYGMDFEAYKMKVASSPVVFSGMRRTSSVSSRSTGIFLSMTDFELEMLSEKVQSSFTTTLEHIISKSQRGTDVQTSRTSHNKCGCTVYVL